MLPSECWPCVLADRRVSASSYCRTVKQVRLWREHVFAQCQWQCHIFKTKKCQEPNNLCIVSFKHTIVNFLQRWRTVWQLYRIRETGFVRIEIAQSHPAMFVFSVLWICCLSCMKWMNGKGKKITQKEERKLKHLLPGFHGRRWSILLKVNAMKQWSNTM